MNVCFHYLNLEQFKIFFSNELALYYIIRYYANFPNDQSPLNFSINFEMPICQTHTHFNTFSLVKLKIIVLKMSDV